MRVNMTILSAAISSTLLSQSAVAAPSQEEMWQMMLELKQQNESLRQEVRSLKGQQAETNEKLEATATAVEETGNRVEKSVGWHERTKFGGYGELHYNNLHDGGGNGNKDGNDFEEIDLHRVILEFSHEFNEDIRMFAEVEFEHVNETFVEQAWIDFDVNDNNTIRAGVFLMPIGIQNETHEPPNFYGVERSLVETEIIPGTWFEGGVGAYGQLGNGFSYDVYFHSGLQIGNDFRIRGARQKVSDANARDWAGTGRLKYTGITGLALSATLHYQEDASQSATAGVENTEAWLWETNAIYQNGPFTIKALYAEWNFDNDQFEAANADEQTGWYIEPSWKITHNFGIFARISEVERARNGIQSEIDQIDFGFNYWPHEDVVVKADYQIQETSKDDPALDEFTGFNLGIGYQF